MSTANIREAAKEVLTETGLHYRSFIENHVDAIWRLSRAQLTSRLVRLSEEVNQLRSQVSGR